MLRDEIRRSPSGNDILSLLVATRDEDGNPMPEAELLDELRTLLVAGHETTATSIAWAAYELARNPEVQANLAEECAASDDTAPYLAATCDETLRMHLVAPMAGRTLARPWSMGGFALPRGTAIGAAMAVTHFEPSIFPHPEVFRPERFLGARYSPFEYLPFGGGARRCLGAALATYELRAVVAGLSRRFFLEPLDRRTIKARIGGIALTPSEPIRVRLRPAFSAAAQQSW
jgi:cytochrome P450